MSEIQPSREAAVLDRIEAFRRRRTRFTDEVITLAHGAGGKASNALIEAVFVEAFANDTLSPMADGAYLTVSAGQRLVFSTDSFVVKPLRFPGGSIGHLAVHGTVNDLAVMGAKPRWLSAAFVLEEGLAVSELRAVVADMAAAAEAAGVEIVTGDTKVVNRGAADGMYITTAGVGEMRSDCVLGAGRVKPGDCVIVSGSIADHGVAVMLARGDLALEADVRSDTAPLGGLVEVLFSAAPSTRWLRDPTRGGVATVCNELAQATNLSIILEERWLPVRPEVSGACDLLGIDPLYVANEGKFVAVVASGEVDAALAALRSHPLGQEASRIGEVRADPPGIVVLLTTFGGTRIVDMLVGDPLPRDLLTMNGPRPLEIGAPLERCQIRVSGTVQGVGFRPFVYRHALALALSGFVRNDSAGVLIDVQGRPPAVAELCRRLTSDPPPLARVDAVTVVPLPVDPKNDGFIIVESRGGMAPDVAVTVDAGTCADCLAEVDDPADRRFGYPFTNCTNCGPRYTIVLSVPYDRAATTMATFAMCPLCRHEYDDPADRRFHAQPNACPECGPRLRHCDSGGQPLTEGRDALESAAIALDAGAILAVKGVGGFHLAVDGTDDAAVARLRRRKARDDKPFALMVEDLAMAHRLVTLDSGAEATLVSARRPIVLARRRRASMIAPGVAPGLPELGVMLPYTALHHLLMARLHRPLVLTSGNGSDDPIAHTDDDARFRLGPLVDGIVTHDRPIHIRCDDSVVRARGGRIQVLRRSRGFAPEPFRLPFTARTQVLAVGAELKNTVSVLKGEALFASHHIGDLEHLATYQSFVQAIDHLSRLFGVVPDEVAHDLHPEYLSTKVASELGLATVGVQHHHAHIASCLVDHGRVDRVLGVAFDGLGYGTDGTLWGGEFLVADLEGFERVGHLQAVALPGGTAAIREPWRMALAWLHHSVGGRAACSIGRRLDQRAPGIVALIESPATAATTSMGRMFDAMAGLIGLRNRVSYEGQAAIELEALAHSEAIGSVGPYPMECRSEGGQLVLDGAPLFVAALADLSDDMAPSVISAAFHEGVGMATVDAAASLAAAHGLGTVALSGGVFQNARLTDIVVDGLEARGLEVLVHRHVPPNDGGISIGQAAVAAFRGTGRGTVAGDGGKSTHCHIDGPGGG